MNISQFHVSCIQKTDNRPISQSAGRSITLNILNAHNNT
jgi:hypothetical protein